MVDKRNQQLQCPYCERVFQQKQRYSNHIDTKHAEEHAAAQEEEASTSQQQEGQSKVMQVGSKAGYYTKKSPHLLLMEQCQIEKRIKPKIKVVVRCCYHFPPQNVCVGCMSSGTCRANCTAAAVAVCCQACCVCADAVCRVFAVLKLLCCL